MPVLILRSLAPALLVLCISLTSADARAFDHTAYQSVLTAHAQGGGMDYAALSTDTAARASLDRFVASLGSMPDAAPLADWLNAYNAIVI
jgi:hypothetical protein